MPKTDYKKRLQLLRGKLEARFIAPICFTIVLLAQWGSSLIPPKVMPGGIGDSRFNLLMLEHTYQSLKGNGSLFDANFFFPFKLVGGLSDLHIGSVVAYAIPRLAGINWYWSMKIWIVCGLILNYLAAALVCKKLGLNLQLRILVGLIFTFDLPAFAQQGHEQLLWRFDVPLCTYFLLLLLSRYTSRNLLYFLGFLAHAFLCNVYTGTYTLIWLIVFGVFLRASKWKIDLEPNSLDKFKKAKATAAIFTISCSVYIYFFYWLTSKTYGIHRSAREIQFFSPTPSSWISSMSSYTWKPVSKILHQQAGWWETQLFLGIGITILILIALRQFWVSQLGYLARPMLFAVVFLALSVTLFGNGSIFMLTTYIPGINSMRVPARIVLVLLFPLAFLAASGLQALTEVSGARFKGKKFFTLIVLALVATDLMLVYPERSNISDWDYRAKSLIAKNSSIINQNPNAILLTLPDTGHRYIGDNQIDGMVVGAILNRKTMNGYSAWSPMKNNYPKSCEGLKLWLSKNKNELDLNNKTRASLYDFQVLGLGEAETCLIEPISQKRKTNL